MNSVTTGFLAAFLAVSAIASEDPLDNLFASISKRDFKSAYVFIKENQRRRSGEHENKLKYTDQFGQEAFVSATSLYGTIEQIEKTDRTCLETLKANKPEKLSSCTKDGELGKLLISLQAYSEASLGAFTEKYDSVFLTYLKAQQKQEEEKALAKKKAMDEEEKIRATPEYNKCAAISDLAYSQKILGYWRKNLIRQKELAKIAGGASNQMIKEIENSMGAIEAYQIRISNNEAKISNLKQTNVTAEKCKQFKLRSNFEAAESLD